MGDIQFNGTPEEWESLVNKNKKETAVDLFFEKIKSHFDNDGDKLESLTFLYFICKQKEKAEMIQVFIAANGYDKSSDDYDEIYMEAEQYYNETYGKQ